MSTLWTKVSFSPPSTRTQVPRSCSGFQTPVTQVVFPVISKIPSSTGGGGLRRRTGCHARCFPTFSPFHLTRISLAEKLNPLRKLMTPRENHRASKIKVSYATLSRPYPFMFYESRGKLSGQGFAARLHSWGAGQLST